MGTELVTGILEIDKRATRIRQISTFLGRTPNDPTVPAKLVEDYQLQPGVLLEVEVANKQNRVMVDKLISVCGLSPEDWLERMQFDSGTVIDPQPQLQLEVETKIQKTTNQLYGDSAMRIVDLICPLGRGQRALIVSPPRSGKTVLLQQMANSLAANYPELEIILLLVDERPEEVTDMRRNVAGQVFASCNDRDVASHLRLAQLVIEYAKHLVEGGKDVVVLLDSLTRVGRAFNIGQRGSGRTMSGGIDSKALQVPKRLFGAARNIENGGSLTIIATVLIDTGSRMDEIIFQEFKGTGNMELILNRKLSNERIFPAIDIPASGTRKEHLLVGDMLPAYNALRRHFTRMKPREAMEALLKAIGRFPTNKEMLGSLVNTS